MKLAALSLALAFRASTVAAPLEFTAYIQSSDKIQLLMTDTADGHSSGWLAIGASFRGYILTAFDGKAETLILKRESETLILPLKDAKVKAARPRPPEYASTSYALKKGDTGEKIVRESGITMEELIDLNRDVNWARLRVGQLIRLPSP